MPLPGGQLLLSVHKKEIPEQEKKFRSADTIVRRAFPFAGAQNGNPGAGKEIPAREKFFPRCNRRYGSIPGLIT